MREKRKEREEEWGERMTYIYLAQHRKAHTIVDAAKLLNLIVGAGILVAELVGREGDNLKVVWVFGFNVLVQLLEAVKLRCEAALGRRVDDEDDFALELGEVVGLALFCKRRVKRLVLEAKSCRVDGRLGGDVRGVADSEGRERECRCVCFEVCLV